MTYPPQDPAAQPGGQYGQPSQPGAQPAAGGYAPGQVGGDPYPAPSYPASSYPADTQATSQLPGQYPGQPEAQYQQYDPASGYQVQYGQYGPPPVQPNTKSGAGTAFLVIGVVVLMVLGGLGGYYFLGKGGGEEGTLADDEATVENTPGGGNGEDEGSEDGGEESEEAPVPSGTHLTVTSLESVTPIPGPEWQYAAGPGVSSEPLADAELYQVNHTEAWVSLFAVGLYSGASAVFDPADLPASALSASEVWLGDGFSTVENYEQSEVTYTEVEVDGRPGVLAEWRNSWTASPDTTDLYEDTALLVVDVDGVNGFIGVASVSESGTAMYTPAVEALLATDFGAENA